MALFYAEQGKRGLRGEAVRVGRSERAAVLVCFRRAKATPERNLARARKNASGSRALDTIEPAGLGGSSEARFRPVSWQFLNG